MKLKFEGDYSTDAGVEVELHDACRTCFRCVETRKSKRTYAILFQ